MATRRDILSDYYKVPKTKAGILSDYAKMTRLANDRLRAIEQARSTDGLKGITQYAYKRAVHDLAGATRFPSAKKIEDMNYNYVTKKLQDLRQFLKAESSTKRGIQAIYKRNAAAFNKKYGTNYSTSELAKFFDKNTGLYEKIKKDHPEYGSETIMKAIAQIEKNRDDILESLEEENRNHLEVDEVKVEEAANQFIAEYGDEVRDLFNS